MPTSRTLGTWLRAYAGSGPIRDLRDDFLADCRRKKILASSIKTGSEMERLMYRTSREFGGVPCSGAFEALEEACILYGDPWRNQCNEDDG